MAKHLNISICTKCEEVIKPCTNIELINFYKQFRKDNLDGHISCCFRGKEEQEVAFATGHSKAHFGESAHSYALALDWFRITQAGGAEWDSIWYKNHLKPACEAAGLEWGGNWSFKDLPHSEIKNWKALVKK